MENRTKIFSIPNKVDVYWDEEGKAIIDVWTSYFVSKEEFNDLVLNKSLEYAKANGGVAWIVDSHKAIGALSRDIHEGIGTIIFPAIVKEGIQYFITTVSDNYMTKKTVDISSSKTGPNGLILVEVRDVDEAINWLKKNHKA